MSTSTYLTSWLIYVMASSILLFVIWRLLRRWLTVATVVSINLIVAVLLLLPARVLLDEPALAPAIVICLLEFTLREDHLAGVAALNRLLIALLVTLVPVCLTLLWGRRLQRNKDSSY